MDDIEKVLTRGVEQILPSRDGLAKLMRETKITLYQGFDPSSSRLHVGNLIGIRKLAQFQRLGHKVIFLIGDFTGMIGDPTDKSAARKKLTRGEVLENAKGYRSQIEKILKFDGENPAEIKYNSEWLSKLNFAEIIELTTNFTVQQLLERDFFQARIKSEKPIYLHEFLYPVMQGYDSVMMDVDLEIGGNDQLFNMMAGRGLMRSLKNKDKYVLTMKILADSTGKKMGKSEGNTINLTDSAEEIYGKAMAMKDDIIDLAAELLTDLPLDFAHEHEPMDAKKQLAFEVVRQIYDEEAANLASDFFEKTFQKKEIPSDEIETVEVLGGELNLLDLVSKYGELSRSEAKRLIKSGGVDVGDNQNNDPQSEIKIGNGVVIKIGKKKFVRIVSK